MHHRLSKVDKVDTHDYRTKAYQLVVMQRCSDAVSGDGWFYEDE